jgi:hypothetical protein
MKLKFWNKRDKKYDEYESIRDLLEKQGHRLDAQALSCLMRKIRGDENAGIKPDAHLALEFLKARYPNDFKPRPVVQEPKTGITKDQLDAVYHDRNLLALLCARLAEQLQFDVFLSDDPEEEDGKWYIIFIELPTGQVSYHVPGELVYGQNWPDGKSSEWDKHSTPDKHIRIVKYLEKWSDRE